MSGGRGVHRQVGGLLALNGVLLGVLAWVSLSPEAGAFSSGHGAGQPGAGQPLTRARGDYSMVAGPIRTGNASAIWILDAANQELAVLRFNDSKQQLEGIGFRDLSADAQRRPGR